jgi:hypothetical protein
MYKLDRNSFKAHTVEEADNHALYYKTLSWKERLRITIYLNSIAYGLAGKPEPKMDKTKFKARARE